MGDSSCESEEKYEIYETGSDMLCVIDLDNSKQTSTKSSVTKPRYRQSYREAWESMRDFKGWLTSVPGNSSKAYCKLCKKELHCHRLSLLKHKVTFKHHKKEEEQKLFKLCGDKTETNSNVIKKLENDNQEEIVTNTETIVFETEGDINEVDENVIIPKIAVPETSEVPFQDNEEEPVSQSGSLSTHILDISRGIPGALIHVVLYKLIDGRWTLIFEGLTGSDGRYSFLNMNQNEFSVGRYKLHFDVDKYFEKLNQETIFPFIEVAFDVKDNSSHYHIPLLLSPYGYSTYRGS